MSSTRELSKYACKWVIIWTQAHKREDTNNFFNRFSTSTSSLLAHQSFSQVGLHSFTMATNLYNLQATRDLLHKHSTGTKEACTSTSLEPLTSLPSPTSSAKEFTNNKPSFSSTSQVPKCLATSSKHHWGNHLQTQLEQPPWNYTLFTSTHHEQWESPLRSTSSSKA